jgi:hypothetical protein
LEQASTSVKNTKNKETPISQLKKEKAFAVSVFLHCVWCDCAAGLGKGALGDWN